MGAAAGLGRSSLKGLEQIVCGYALKDNHGALCLSVFCLGGEKEEGDDGQDLRRTESDSGLKKVFLPHIHSLAPPVAHPPESVAFGAFPL